MIDFECWNGERQPTWLIPTTNEITRHIMQISPYQDQDAAKDALETIIDLHGIATVLELISIVCSDKEDHVRANGQDADLGAQWAQAHKLTDRCSQKLSTLLDIA